MHIIYPIVAILAVVNAAPHRQGSGKGVSREQGESEQGVAASDQRLDNSSRSGSGSRRHSGKRQHHRYIQPEDDDDDDEETEASYTIILDADEEVPANISAILAELKLTPDDDRVTAVYDNAAFRGFSINANKVSRNIMRNMSSVAIMEKAIKISSTVQERNGVPWGLERISSGSGNGVEMGLESIYKYDDSSYGQGADIYIVDTGVDITHPQFSGRAVAAPGYSEIDTAGHGTHVAGIAASDTYGVSNKANIISVEALPGGEGNSNAVTQAIDFVAKQHVIRRDQPGFVGSVVSLSLSTPYGSPLPSFKQALIAATELGIHVVVAAGNDGQDACQISPADAGGVTQSVISVGAIAFNNSIASFSNTGTCVDIYAPGVNILSTYPGGTTEYLSGTSMAAPYVSGVVAYLMAENATLAGNPVAMKEHLRDTALRGIVGGKYLTGDSHLLLNNGVPVGATMQQIRAKLAEVAAA